MSRYASFCDIGALWITHHTFFFCTHEIQRLENIGVSISSRKDTGDFSTSAATSIYIFCSYWAKEYYQMIRSLVSFARRNHPARRSQLHSYPHSLRNSQPGYPALRRNSAQRKTIFYCLSRPAKHHVSCRNPRILQ